MTNGRPLLWNDYEGYGCIAVTLWPYFRNDNGMTMSKSFQQGRGECQGEAGGTQVHGKEVPPF